MTDSPSNTPPNDLAEVSIRNRIARDLAEGFAEEFPSDIWRELATAFADIPALSAEITHLRADLADARLNRANLAAAALATLAAHSDGEADPLSYLRDELRAQGYDPSRNRR